MAEAARRAEDGVDPGAGPGALRIGVLAYQGCFASEVFGVPDLLTMAGHVAGPDAPGYQVSVVSPRRRVTASGGASLDVRPVREVDVLVVPGFELRPDTDLDARLARPSPSASARSCSPRLGSSTGARPPPPGCTPANWPGAAQTPTCGPSTWSSPTRG